MRGGAQGSFGRVFLGKWRETTVAIKLLNEPGVAPGADFWDAPDPAALPAAQRCAQHCRSARLQPSGGCLCALACTRGSVVASTLLQQHGS